MCVCVCECVRVHVFMLVCVCVCVCVYTTYFNKMEEVTIINTGRVNCFDAVFETILVIAYGMARIPVWNFAVNRPQDSLVVVPSLAVNDGVRTGDSQAFGKREKIC